MFRDPSLRPALALLTCFLAHVPLQAQASSGFDAGDEGWRVIEHPGPPYDVIVDGPYSAFWDSSAGNPGGAIRTIDQDGNLFLFSAPASFLGDQSAVVGGCLTYDLLFVDNGLAPGTEHPDVVLWGGNGDVLLIDAFQDPAEQTGQWASYSVSLGYQAGWRHDALNGPLVTPAELDAVLGDLAGLFIRGDLWSGVEITYLDNPTLSAAGSCVGTQYCFCSLGPCANNDSGAGCENSTGQGARLSSSSGSASVAADDLVISASQVPANQPGLLFMGGGTSIGTPFGDGRLCVTPGGGFICRYPVQNAGPSGVLSEGPGIVAFSQTQGAACTITVGSTWNFQAWYRDPFGPCGGAFNTSNALAVTFTL